MNPLKAWNIIYPKQHILCLVFNCQFQKYFPTGKLYNAGVLMAFICKVVDDLINITWRTFPTISYRIWEESLILQISMLLLMILYMWFLYLEIPQYLSFLEVYPYLWFWDPETSTYWVYLIHTIVKRIRRTKITIKIFIFNNVWQHFWDILTTLHT